MEIIRYHTKIMRIKNCKKICEKMILLNQVKYENWSKSYTEK